MASVSPLDGNQSTNSSEHESHIDTRFPSSASFDDSVSTAINAPYRVGNVDADTCSYHALLPGASCRKPRMCYECLNSDVAGLATGCLLAPSGFCEDMSSFALSLDFRRNTTNDELREYNYFPSTNTTYCEPIDEACLLCRQLAKTDATRQQDTINATNELERRFCVGQNNCVCLMVCESAHWEANMPLECNSSDNLSKDLKASKSLGTTHSTLLIIFLVLQVAFLAGFIYKKRGLCRRTTPSTRPEGPYNNVDAILSPSNRLRLSGWKKMQNTLIEREKMQQSEQLPQQIASQSVDNASIEARECSSSAHSRSPQDSAQTSEIARAGDDELRTGDDGYRERHQKPIVAPFESSDSDGSAVEGICDERIIVGSTSRVERAASSVAMLEAHRNAG